MENKERVFDEPVRFLPRPVFNAEGVKKTIEATNKIVDDMLSCYKQDDDYENFDEEMQWFYEWLYEWSLK